MKSIISIDKINQLTKNDFISIFGNIFEKTKWIADSTYNLKPYKNTKELSATMVKIYENSKKEDCLKIFNAHPELTVEKNLTEDSKSEQNNSNLNQCNDDEFKEFQILNIKYKKKFGFPFIIAVKGKNKKEILDNFRKRIENKIELEFEEAKEQVKKIANSRLNKIID
jgi:OHCU decarboxylase